jgi:hypothetical protein
MVNKWMMHVKKTMKKMSGQKKSLGKGWFKHVLKAAKTSYHKKGGEVVSEKEGEKEVETPEVPEVKPAATTGGRTKRRRRRHH